MLNNNVLWRRNHNTAPRVCDSNQQLGVDPCSVGVSLILRQ